MSTTVRHGGMNASARPQYGNGLVFIVHGMGGMLAAAGALRVVRGGFGANGE